MLSKAYVALGKWITRHAPWKVAVLCQCALYSDQNLPHHPVLVYAHEMGHHETQEALDAALVRANYWLVPAALYAAIKYHLSVKKPATKGDWVHHGVDNAGR